MPVTVKPYYCVFCNEVDRRMFWGGRKSCCKNCLKKTTSIDRKKAVLLAYECKECGDTDQGNFYTYCKNKCRKHYNKTNKDLPRINIIRISSEE